MSVLISVNQPTAGTALLRLLSLQKLTCRAFVKQRIGNCHPARIFRKPFSCQGLFGNQPHLVRAENLFLT